MGCIEKNPDTQQGGNVILSFLIRSPSRLIINAICYSIRGCFFYMSASALYSFSASFTWTMLLWQNGVHPPRRALNTVKCQTVSQSSREQDFMRLMWPSCLYSYLFYVVTHLENLYELRNQAVLKMVICGQISQLYTCQSEVNMSPPPTNDYSHHPFISWLLSGLLVSLQCQKLQKKKRKEMLVTTSQSL